MSAPRRARRRDMVRHMLHPRQFLDSLVVGPQVSLRNSTLAGAQAALTILIALPWFYYVSPWPHLLGFASLGALVALFGRFDGSGRRKLRLLECAVIQMGTVFVLSAAAWLGASGTLQLGLLALGCGGLYFIGMRRRLGPPGPLIFVFAASASVSPQGLTLFQLGERVMAVAAVAALAWGLSVLTDGLRGQPKVQAVVPQEPVPPVGNLLINSARCAAGAGLAMAISHVLGGGHPAWAAMGVVAVLQGPHLHLVMNRAIQRMAGTLVGAILAWMLLSQTPDVLTVILVLACLQTATEMVIGFNYGLGQIFVTPMALMMTWLGSTQALGPEIAPERVLETCLGAVVGVLLAVVFSTLDDRQHLAKMRGG